MSTRKRKSGSRKNSGSLLTILLVIVLLAIIAAVAAYYLTKKPVPGKKLPTEQVTNQKENKNKQPENSASGKSETKTFLEGTWVSQNDGAMLEFHYNTFSIDLPSVDSQSYQKGTFSITGNEITFSYSNAKVPCGSEKGTYTYKLSNGSLQLKAQNDPCKIRKQKLVAVWDRFNDK